MSIMPLELSFLLQLFQTFKDVIYGDITFSSTGFEKFLNLVGNFPCWSDYRFIHDKASKGIQTFAEKTLTLFPSCYLI